MGDDDEARQLKALVMTVSFWKSGTQFSFYCAWTWGDTANGQEAACFLYEPCRNSSLLSVWLKDPRRRHGATGIKKQRFEALVSNRCSSCVLARSLAVILDCHFVREPVLGALRSEFCNGTVCYNMLNQRYWSHYFACENELQWLQSD